MAMGYMLKFGFAGFRAMLCLFLFACEEEPKAVVHTEPVPGKIVIFNSSGILLAAEDARTVLRSSGFDILSATTDPQWLNYEETIIAIRNPHWEGYNRLKENLHTKNFIFLLDTTLSEIISATVYLGKDYRKVIGIKRGEL
jgi:hypothetical protein